MYIDEHNMKLIISALEYLASDLYGTTDKEELECIALYETLAKKYGMM